MIPSLLNKSQRFDLELDGIEIVENAISEYTCQQAIESIRTYLNGNKIASSTRLSLHDLSVIDLSRLLQSIVTFAEIYFKSKTNVQMRDIELYDLHLNSPQGAWHRDCIDKELFNCRLTSSEDYHVYKIAIYLSTYHGNKPTFSFIPRSHRQSVSNINLLLLRLSNFLFKRLRRITGKLAPFFPTISPLGAHSINPKLGSLVIFDERLIHKGARKPLISNDRKIAFYVTFALPQNTHTLDHSHHYSSKNAMRSIAL